MVFCAVELSEGDGRMNTKRRSALRSGVSLHLLMIPGVIFTVIFSYIPMAGIAMAFQDYRSTKGLFEQKWVGFKYFERLFKMPDFYSILTNTLIIAVLKIGTLLLFSLVLALLLNEIKSRRLRSGLQSMMIFPHFLSWIILGELVRSLLADNGLVNNILGHFGAGPVFFLGDPDLFRGVLVVTNLWQEAGFSAILYMAAIAGVDASLYEAAEMDGASRWQQTVHITLGLIRPFIILLLILNIGNILNAGFDQVFNLYNGLVLSKADIIDTYVYRVGLLGAQYSFGTAVGLFKSIIGVGLIGGSYYLADRFAGYRIF